MIEKIREWLKRDLWSMGSKAMQKEIIDCHNIILALVEVVEKADEVKESSYHDCADQPTLQKDMRMIHAKLADALTTADEKIGEVLGEKCERCGGSEVVYRHHIDCDCRKICPDSLCGCYPEKRPCPDCKPVKSTYFHSDPSTDKVEKRTQEED